MQRIKSKFTTNSPLLLLHEQSDNVYILTGNVFFKSRSMMTHVALHINKPLLRYAGWIWTVTSVLSKSVGCISSDFLCACLFVKSNNNKQQWSVQAGDQTVEYSSPVHVKREMFYLLHLYLSNNNTYSYWKKKKSTNWKIRITDY